MTPRIGRAARGVALVLTLVALPVIVTAAALGLLLWTSLLVWAGVLATLLVSLRAAAVRERTRRHTAAQLRATDPSRRREAATLRSAPRSARPVSRPPTDAATAGVAPAAGVESPVVAATPGLNVGAVQSELVSAPATEPGPERQSVVRPEIVAFADFGVDPTSVILGPPDEDALHGQWSPVDVPPPTYTLKAKATYPLGASVAETGATSTGPTALDVIDVEDDDVPARWVVGG